MTRQDRDLDQTGLSLSENGRFLIISGVVDTSHLSRLQLQWSSLESKSLSVESIDASEVVKLDSAGALFLDRVLTTLQNGQCPVALKGLSQEAKVLFDHVMVQAKKINLSLIDKHSKPMLYQIGLWAMDKMTQMTLLCAFIGEFFSVLLRDIVMPFKLSWRDVMDNVDSCGFKALSIVGLMSFLIGIVLAYQLGDQLRSYGANIYVVDVTGVGILREFSPLITAIIMAGRTSTSFAALIGSMKVNQEIDALAVMGIRPISRLVMPRVVALIIVMPLLIVWADIFGILGSMLMAKESLDISFTVFLDRLHYHVPVIHYVLGLVKAPAFALVIAGIGCFQGLCVTNSAVSVGEKTTKAAVQAIFLIIVMDAVFSILFSWMDV